MSYPKYDWRINDAQIYSFLWKSMETQISSTLIFSQVIHLILWKKYQSYTPFSNFLYGNKRLSLMFQIAFFNQIMPMNCFIHHGINLFIIMAKFISHPVHLSEILQGVTWIQSSLDAFLVATLQTQSCTLDFYLLYYLLIIRRKKFIYKEIHYNVFLHIYIWIPSWQ